MPRSTTNDILTEIADDAYKGQRDRHWTKIAISMLGENPPRRDPQSRMFLFWHSVGYYNFIPVCVGFGPRARPDDSLFKAGHKGYRTVVERLKPQAVIIFSRSVWKTLYPDVRPKNGIARTVDNGVLIIGVPHPSSYQFGNARDWTLPIRAALQSLQSNIGDIKAAWKTESPRLTND